MILDPHRLQPLRPECRICVVIPARDEARDLPATLAGFARQRTHGGGHFDNGLFELIVFCNGCTDGTAAAARAFAAEHPWLPLEIFEATAADVANVGEARGAALDAVARRFLAAGKPHGILASTDADTIVDPAWIAEILHEMTAADAVGGYVQVADDERDRMLAPQRLFYDREIAYRRLLGAIEDRFDPRPYDPSPRHDAFVGASFAVSSRAHAEAGGLPRLSFHEDVAFAAALDRAGARIRHSMRVRAHTSPRGASRVRNGFGDFLCELARKGAEREPHLVRAATATIESARARRILRSIDDDLSTQRPIRKAARLLGIDERTILAIAAESATEGERWSRLAPLARQSRYAGQPVEVVIASFRRALQRPIAAPRADAACETG